MESRSSIFGKPADRRRWHANCIVGFRGARLGSGPIGYYCASAGRHGALMEEQIKVPPAAITREEVLAWEIMF